MPPRKGSILEMSKERKIIIVSVVAFVAIILSSLFVEDFVISSNMVFIGIAILMVPYSLYKFFELKKIKEYEEVFPSFLRDLAESQRSGLSTIQAIHMAAKSDYGNLTEEIKKMDNQLSWNVQLTKVLDSFSKRMKRSKTITKSLMIIDQANKSGGNIEDTMDSLANSIDSIKDVQEEKKVVLSQQVIMMYAIFFIFLGISIALIKFLIPMIQTQLETQSQTGLGMSSSFGFSTSSPCEPCITGTNPACFSCEIFFGISAAFGFGEKSDSVAYYKSLFFAMIIIQGFFCGLIIGQIGSESVVAGIKHSMILLFSGVFIFIFVIKLGLV